MARRARILHFSTFINRDDFIHSLMVHCDLNRFEFLGATLSSVGSLSARPEGLTLLPIKKATGVTYALTAVRLRKLCVRERIDVLHSHHFEPGLLAALATVGRPIPLVLGRHYSDSIHQLTAGARRRLYLAVEGFCNRRATAIVAPAAHVEAVLRRQGVPSRKIQRIPYGFDFDRFGSRTGEAIERAAGLWPEGPTPRAATFARLHREKGHAYLLEAVAILKRRGEIIRLLVVGDGPERSALQAQAAHLGLDRQVRFAGWRTDVLDIMAAADLVVQPTLHEAFSQVMVESMAMGKALVITAVSGVADVVVDGQSGLIVPVRDAAALAVAVSRATDPGLAALLGRQASALVRGELDIRRVAASMSGLYEGILQNHSRGTLQPTHDGR